MMAKRDVINNEVIQTGMQWRQTHHVEMLYQPMQLLCLSPRYMHKHPVTMWRYVSALKAAKISYWTRQHQKMSFCEADVERHHADWLYWPLCVWVCVCAHPCCRNCSNIDVSFPRWKLLGVFAGLPLSWARQCDAQLTLHARISEILDMNKWTLKHWLLEVVTLETFLIFIKRKVQVI
jgi:hypothetical protein